MLVVIDDKHFEIMNWRVDEACALSYKVLQRVALVIANGSELYHIRSKFDNLPDITNASQVMW